MLCWAAVPNTPLPWELMGVGSLGHPSLGIILSLAEPPCPKMPEDQLLRNSRWLTEPVLSHSPILKTGFTVVQRCSVSLLSSFSFPDPPPHSLRALPQQTTGINPISDSDSTKPIYAKWLQEDGRPRLW